MKSDSNPRFTILNTVLKNIAHGFVYIESLQHQFGHDDALQQLCSPYVI